MRRSTPTPELDSRRRWFGDLAAIERGDSAVACYAVGMGDDPMSLPIWLVLVVVVAMPLGVALFFGLFAFRGIAPLAFRCGRCGRIFVRPPFRRFPSACGRCGARDWNA